MSDKPTTSTGRGGYRGQKSPVIGDNGVSVKPGDNAKYAAMAWELMAWAKVDRGDIQALETRLAEYAQYCIDNDIRPGNLACYAALGITKQIAHDWEHGVYGTSCHMDFIKRVKAFCGVTREHLGQDGKLNPATLIFWQKNWDGLKDVQDVTILPSNPLGEVETPEQLETRRQRYLAAGVDD